MYEFQGVRHGNERATIDLAGPRDSGKLDNAAKLCEVAIPRVGEPTGAIMRGVWDLQKGLGQGGCVPDEAPLMAKLVFRGGDFDQDSGGPKWFEKKRSRVQKEGSPLMLQQGVFIPVE
ncbi:hypothetical protein B296_00014519 [Ensete ventricosum]|uniref:Uncharacterized protein n=1 Tax=Ensete ventricosum TaxID=4639 RepID=A0A426ZVD5_ENSVE|nr:hypothetical protein B296_00014519 [Ensete ventricosum]